MPVAGIHQFRISFQAVAPEPTCEGSGSTLRRRRGHRKFNRKGL